MLEVLRRYNYTHIGTAQVVVIEAAVESEVTNEN